MSGSLVEMFEGNLFQRLLLNDKSDKIDHLKNESVKESEEVHISLIGPFVWSPEYFISSISRSSSFDDSASGGDSEAPQLKPNEDATEPVKKKGFDSQMSSSNPDDLNSNKREKRKLATARMTANEVSQELSKANVNPHMLIAPHIYGESFGAGASASQPFKITVHPQVGFLCDLHGHLCEAEVIGLLAGRWDAEATILYVQAAFPCTSTERREDDGSTDVELDPAAELAVREIISSFGLIVVGWYHSHPQFRPDPSVTDIHNQQQYQTLMRDEDSGLEPFIGLIVSTFDEKLSSVESHHQWFHTRPYADGVRGKKPVSIPMLLDVNIGVYVEAQQGVQALLGDDETEELIQRLCRLSPVTAVEESKESGDSDVRNGIHSDIEKPSQEEREEDDYSMDSEGETSEFEKPLNSASAAGGVYHSAVPVPMHFRASGGPEHFDDTLTLTSTPIVAVKRKYTKRVAEPATFEANERRSGRETKAPVMFVPEKDEKVAKVPSVVVLPLVPPPTPPLKSKLAGKIKKKPGRVKNAGTVVGTLSKMQSEGQGHYSAPKEQGGVFVGAIGKWLSAGAVLVTPGMRPAVSGKKAIGTVKKEAAVINAVSAVPGVKKRQGPGARGFKALYSVPVSRPHQQPITVEEVAEEVSSGSSVRVVKRKRGSLPSGKTAKRQTSQDVVSLPQYDEKEIKSEKSKVGARSKKDVSLKPRKRIKKQPNGFEDLSDGMANTNGVDEVEKEVVCMTLLQLLQGSSAAAAKGRRLICCAKPAYRCLLLGTATLGFYYSTYSRRVCLGSVWKDGILKSDKLKGSITYWAARLGINSSSQTCLVEDIVSFLLSSWAEGEGQMHILPIVAQKKKRTISNDSHNCSSHINAEGKIVTYREDDGRDDSPKKKKKKKSLKNKVLFSPS